MLWCGSAASANNIYTQFCHLFHFISKIVYTICMACLSTDNLLISAVW